MDVNETVRVVHPLPPLVQACTDNVPGGRGRGEGRRRPCSRRERCGPSDLEQTAVILRHRYSSLIQPVGRVIGAFHSTSRSVTCPLFGRRVFSPGMAAPQNDDLFPETHDWVLPSVEFNNPPRSSRIPKKGGSGARPLENWISPWLWADEPSIINKCYVILSRSDVKGVNQGDCETTPKANSLDRVQPRSPKPRLCSHLRGMQCSAHR